MGEYVLSVKACVCVCVCVQMGARGAVIEVLLAGPPSPGAAAGQHGLHLARGMGGGTGGG